MHNINICFKQGQNMYFLSVMPLKLYVNLLFMLLTRSMLGKKFNRPHFERDFFFFPKNSFDSSCLRRQFT